MCRRRRSGRNRPNCGVSSQFLKVMPGDINVGSCVWFSIKYLDPAESGAVIPILHVNGFKISERTIFGCMDDKELICLFSGYGYQVSIVKDLAKIDESLSSSLEWALSEIRHIQNAARSGEPIVKPRWPMIILRTPKASFFGNRAN